MAASYLELLRPSPLRSLRELADRPERLIRHIGAFCTVAILLWYRRPQHVGRLSPNSANRPNSGSLALCFFTHFSRMCVQVGLCMKGKSMYEAVRLYAEWWSLVSYCGLVWGVVCICRY